ERRLGTRSPGGLQQIQRSGCICLKILEGNRRGAIMGWLRRSMYDYRRSQLRHERQNRGTVTDIDRVVLVSGNRVVQKPQGPTRVAFRPEKDRTLIVVHTGNPETPPMKIQAYFRTDQPTRPCDKR